MERARAAIDVLMASGRELAGRLKQGIEEVDGYLVTWGTAVFRGKFARAQRILRDGTSECLQYELDASDLLQQVAHHSGARRLAADTETLGLQAQRDTLRMLLDTLGASVADFKGRCDSRVTNAINFLILVLTISSIAVAVVSYYVAKNSYDVAKQTYDDAVSSGKEQKAAMDTELATLQGQKAVLEAMDKASATQIESLGKIAASAGKQAGYLAAEQLKERKQHESEVQREFAARLQESAERMRAYYQELEDDMQRTSAMKGIAGTTLQAPVDDPAHKRTVNSQHRFDDRALMAESLSQIALSLKSVDWGVDSRAFNDLEQQIDEIRNTKPEFAALDRLDALSNSLSELDKVIASRDSNFKIYDNDLMIVVGCLNGFFDAERRSYEDAYQEYILSAASYASYLVRANLADPGIALSPALSPFGITPRIPVDHGDAGKFAELARLRINEAQFDQERAFDARTGSISESLRSLQASLDLEMSTLARAGQ